MSDTNMNTTWTPGATGWQTLDDLKAAMNEAARNPVKQLGQTEFLNLLVAQMKNQDPLEPQTDTAFIAQLAQFSSLEAMNELSAMVENSTYYNMIGKLVYCEANVEGEIIPITGYVNSIVIKDGKAWAQIGENEFLVECSAIKEIYNEDLLNLDNPLVNNSNLIGKTIEATTFVLDEDGNKIKDEKDPSGFKTEKIVGVVEKMSIENGIVYAHVNVEAEDDEGNPITKEEKVAIVSITNIKK